MANFHGQIYRTIFCAYFVCMVIVSARQAVAPTIEDEIVFPYVGLAAPKDTATRFEPLKMKFTNTKRTGAKAEQYKEEILSELTPGARKEDDNLKMTGESCARGLGDLYKVVTEENKLLYEICYDDKRSSAIYTTHIIDLANKSPERSGHLSFKALYTLRGQKINEMYTAAAQTEKFDKIFGKKLKITEEDIKQMNYFSRNHLTPHADFPLVSEQQLTYFFHNCVPGKQSMNQGNYSTLEDLIRAISTQMEKVLRVFTGVYGILTKKDKKNNSVELYLDQSVDSNKKSVEIPLVIWKLVVDTKTNDSVAFFTSNDTDMDEKQVKVFSTLCDSVCDQLGYYFKDNVKSGITLCCRYEDFVKHIQYLPIQLRKTNLLKNTVRLEKQSRSPSPKGKSLSPIRERKSPSPKLSSRKGEIRNENIVNTILSSR